MANLENGKTRWQPDWKIIAALACVKLAIHLPLINRYGYFRDELYFLDLGRNLDWGYVDCAPLIGLYAKAALLFGGSLPVLRTMAALAGAGLVVLAMIIAARLGGGRYAQLLTGICVIVSPGNLSIDSLFTMNAFEPLFWMGCILVLIRIIQTGNSRLWLVFGVLTGLGLQNKHSMLFFGAAMAVGILLSPERRELAKPWIWIGGAVAVLIFLPNVIWQWQHHFPTIEDLHNVKAMGKNVVLDPLAFIGQQILSMHPLTFPVWISGLFYFFFGKGRRYRAIGVTYLAILGIFIVMAGKTYYLFPAYAMLFAGGAVAITGWLEKSRVTAGKLWPQAVVTTILVLGLVVAPLAVPLLSPQGFLDYEKSLGITRHKTEVNHVGPLPQMFGDQFGWEELVSDVAKIYNALPEEERAKATIFASNYGEAGALHLYGPKYGLPWAICAHQNHYFWGSQGKSGEVVIWLQWGREHLERMFTSVEQAGEHYHPWGMAEENRPIFVCRGMKTPFDKLWPDLKHWN